VLDRALHERREHDVAVDTHPEALAIDERVRELQGIDERIAEIRQRVWMTEEAEPAAAAPR